MFSWVILHNNKKVVAHLNGDLFYFTAQQRARCVGLPNALQLGVVVQEEPEQLVGHIDVGVAAQRSMFFERELAAGKRVLVDLIKTHILS